MQIKDAVIIVTGASSGIGAATARELIQHGARLVLAARRIVQLQALAREIDPSGAQALAVATDVSRREDIDCLVRMALQHFGRIDVLINNAGVGAGMAIVDSTDAILEQVINVNMLAPARLAHAAVPHMKDHGGVIINIGSVTGEIATPGIYSATKWGMRGLTDTLRRELLHDNIAVVLIEPGFVRTEMTATMKIPMPGPELIARAVARSIQRPQRKVISPWYYRFIVLPAKLFPGVTDRIIGNRGFRNRYENR